MQYFKQANEGIIITNAGLLDPEKETITPCRISIVDNKITEIKSTSGIDCYVTPGFINTHLHWFMLGGIKLAEPKEIIENTPITMLDLAISNARITLTKGITTVVDKGPPSEKNSIFLYNTFKNHHRHVLPTTLYSNLTLSCKGAFADEYTKSILSDQDLLETLNLMHRNDAKIIKIIPETELDGSYHYKWVFPEKYMDIITNFAHNNGLITAMHAKGSEALDMAIKYKVNHIEHALQASNSQLARLQENKTYINLTLEGFAKRLEAGKQFNKKYLSYHEYEWEMATNLFHNLLNFNEVKPYKYLTFGSDAGSHNTPHASLDELVLMQNLGMKPWDIIKCATINGASSINMQSTLGIINPGFNADLIIWNNNPLDVLKHNPSSLEKHIVQVFKNGMPISH